MSNLSTFSGGIPNGLPNPDSKIVWDAENPNQIIGTFVVDEKLHRKLQSVLKKIIRDYKNSKKGKGVDGGLDMEMYGGALDEDNVEASVLKCGSADALDLQKKLLQSRIDIESAIQKIKTLQDFSDSANKEILESLKKCDDSNVLYDNTKIINESISNEIDNQINVLETLLHKLIKPSDKEVKEYLKNNKDFETLVEVLLPYDVDTSEASDKLGVAFTSINKIKIISERVRKALKEVNMTIDSYANTVNLPGFNKEYLDILKKNSDIDLSKIVTAMTILKTNFKDRKDIKEYLKKNGKGLYSGGDAEGGIVVNLPTANPDKLGRIERPNSKSTLTKNIKKSQNTITEIYKLFLTEFNTYFNSIKASIDNMSDNINTALSYDENFLQFVDACQELDQLEEKNIFAALIGIGGDSSSTQTKAHFVNTLTHLVSIIETIEKLHNVANLKAIKNDMKAVLESIDTFTDLIKSSKTVKLTGAGDIAGGNADGGALFNENSIDYISFSTSAHVVSDTVRKFKFLGNVLKIKRNLSNLGDFYTENKKDYDELLGKTIGYKLSQVYEYHQGVRQSLSDTTSGLGMLVNNYNTKVAEVPQDAEFAGLAKLDVETLKDLTDLHYDAREGLYKSMEAIDLYLLNFTQAIASDPTAIDTLDKILNSTNVISKFYNNATGNNLAQMFDLFDTDAPIAPDNTLDKINLDDDVVLADYITRTTNHGKNFAKSNANVKAILEKSKEALDGFGALKNILSAFFFIGDNFNKKSTKDNIHMTPNMIYKNLQKYIWASSFNNHLYNTELLTANNGINDNDKLIKLFTFILTSVNNADRHQKRVNIFNADDKYFVLTMKAILSKIFTVVGTYSIMHDPTNKGDLITNPSRLLIGGVVNETVTVDDNLVEHYIRLPLLVEFYRNIFDQGNDKFKKGDPNAVPPSEQVAFIPDVNGIWSGLFSIIFDKSRNLKYGVYDNQNIKSIITEINKISKSFKGKHINDYVDSLVYEVNRRYGIIKKKDIVEYYKTIKMYKDSGETIDDIVIQSTTNFDTLNEGEDVDLPAPSDKYKRSLNSVVSTLSKPSINTDDYNILSNFRKSIDDELNKAVLNDLYKKSFTQYVKIAKTEIAEAKTNENKLDIITRNISNSNDSQIKNNEHYLLFHELIITPLTVLFSQYEIITKNVYAIHQALDALYRLSVPIAGNAEAVSQREYYNSTVAYYAEFPLADRLDPANGNTTQLKIFKRIVELIYNLSSINSEVVSTDLFELKFASSGSLILDFSKYQTVIESLLDNVKSNIVRFKSIIPADIISKYEKSNNVGSIFYLQEYFINKCLKNIHNNKSTDVERKYKNLDSLSTFLKTFNQSTPVTDMQLSNVNFNDFDEFTYELIIRSEDYNENTVLPRDVPLYKDMFRQFDTGTKAWTPLLNNPTIHISTAVKNVNETGLLFSFNQLLKEYLMSFYDISTKKIYTKLFTTIINNSIVNMTELGSGYPDLMGIRNLNTHLPTNAITISASNSFMLNELATRALNPNMPDIKFHSLSELSAVSPHIIETMGTQLPLFIQLFTNIVNKAIYVRRLIIDNGTVSNSPDNIVIDASLSVQTIATIRQTGWEKVVDRDQRLIEYKNILDNIIGCASDMITDASIVLQEVKNLENNKLSLLMDIKKDFIRNYKNITKSLPFTPISQVSMLVNNESHFNLLHPVKSTTIPQVTKFQHGLRPLFTKNDLSFDNVPYMNELLTKYNSSVSTANSIDKKSVSDMLSLFGTVMKYKLSNEMKLFLTNQSSKPTIDEVPANSTFQYNQTIDNDILNLTQDTIVENSVQKIVNFVAGAGARPFVFILDNRDDARILNIIDLNIVPINVHALVKEIPLVNIYNYAYSFDKFMESSKDLPEVKFVNDPYEYILMSTRGIIDQAGVDKVNDMLNLLHTQPNASLGFPRFLMDQLHKKSLFGRTAIIDPAVGPTEHDLIVKRRLESKLVRNLMFITELQRIMRVQIRNKLQTINTRVITNAKILSSEYTELPTADSKYTDNEFTFDN